MTDVLAFDDFDVDAPPRAVSTATGITAMGFGGVAIVSVSGGAVPGAMLGHDLYLSSTTHYMPATPAISMGWLKQSMTTVEELSALPPAWDGHRAPPISRWALKTAARYLQQLGSLVPVPPSVVPTSSGGIALEWHHSGVDLEIELDPTGEVNVYGEDEATGCEFEGPFAQRLSDVAGMLAKFF